MPTAPTQTPALVSGNRSEGYSYPDGCGAKVGAGRNSSFQIGKPVRRRNLRSRGAELADGSNDTSTPVTYHCSRSAATHQRIEALLAK